MTSQERHDRLTSYAKAPELLRDALKKFPRDMWNFKPDPNRWSIHEIVVHLTDSEANCYVRCRRFVAEPGTSVMAYDQDKWAEKLNYHAQNLEDALTLFGLLRKSNAAVLKSASREAWETHTIEHPEAGTMSMDRFLEIYERHTLGHIRQMEDNHRLWKEHRKQQR